MATRSTSKKEQEAFIQFLKDYIVTDLRQIVSYNNVNYLNETLTESVKLNHNELKYAREKYLDWINSPNIDVKLENFRKLRLYILIKLNKKSKCTFGSELFDI